MLKMEEWLLIRDLYSQGLNISEISERTGYDRKTVRKYLQLKTLPEPQKRPPRPSKLDLYKPYLLEKINEKHYTAARLFREIQKMGFDGGETIVKDFVRKVRPKQGVPAVLRYETKPGVQAQVDWGELGTVEVDGKLKKLFCFSMILGYSRMRYVECTLSIDTFTLIQCHLNAFQYFGGCTQEILYDNMKQVVIKRAMKSSDSEWNSQYEDFFKHYGFIPRLCRPYRPQTKGKIENTIGFVKRDFFLGREFSSLESLNNQALEWLNRVNSSIHGTTHEIPLERFKKEKEKLNLLNQVPRYKVVKTETRKISRDCYISYLGNKYSVPYKFAGRTAKLQIFEGKFEVYVDYEKVCEHEILPGNCRVARKKEHFKGLLSEVLNENSKCKKSPHILLKFSGLEVEKRSLDVYETFSDGGLE
ncbi:IS21 family transposase [Methanosarcina barkeri]|uniref:Mobile element protein n=1 Tax=Methanosarcina barkeri 227 TaxID=1434106 RepID=A0A0E3R1U3_METBA|nr:IS21 family transposase [Methanosarcina barkeri]AKB57047.1 Mobile element protein [Methanosarcina barkeri 227]AKB57474.1 Mobile element protein [Methanosarcina barkeri 227]AKB58409.1 Mobile element protein [Methanosarcina barkeri 227]AKB59405.1 Mobile element protein [Methanosarcina barkeri 227]